MQGNDTAKQVARWVALSALFLIPLTPLIVSNAFFFPFITAKAFYFRILVEIAVGAWLVLAFLDKEYRPRFSWIAVAVAGFVAWMFVADLFAVNVGKAFWSNFERMEGWVLLIHLLGFFFAASSVLRVGKAWRAWFLTSLGVSVLICFYALFQLTGGLAIHQGSTRIDASLGNSAYLAIYLLFNSFIALWLALTEKQSWLKWSLIFLAVVEALLIFPTETRGTIVGLVGGLFLASVLTLFTAGKRAKTWATGAVILILLAVGGFYLARNSPAVQNNHILQRVASISVSSLQVRLKIWHMAYEGAVERPVVGWGQEGFNYVFNKYYDPSLHNQEPWFDRAHNAFIDWLTAGGVPAFLLYLALFGSAIVLLWSSSQLSRPERIALTAALAGYACHNLFVFDNLYSYVYFFALLALIDAQVGRTVPVLEKTGVLTPEEGLTYALPIGAVAVATLIWMVNVPGMSVATKLIGALTPAPTVSENTALFQSLTEHPAFALQEIREQLVNYSAAVVNSTTATNEEKQAVVSLAGSEMEKEVAAHPLDARAHIQLSFVFRAVGDAANALKEIQAASALSPAKEEFWVQAGLMEWALGDVAAAQKDFTTAYNLGPQFADLAAYAAAGDIVAGDALNGKKILLASYGTTVVDNDILSLAYFRTKAWSDLIALWKLRASAPGASANVWFGLASAYYAAGDTADAIATIRKAVELYPDAAAAGDAALAQIRAGKAVLGQ